MPLTATAQVPSPQPYYIPPPPPQNGILMDWTLIASIGASSVAAFIAWSFRERYEEAKADTERLTSEIRDIRRETASEVEKTQVELRRLNDTILTMKAELPATFVPHKTYESYMVKLEDMIKALHSRMDQMATTMAKHQRRW